MLPAGTNVIKESKVLMTPTVRLLRSEIEDSIGFIPEVFAVFIFKSGF